ncbi:12198_t:CDS:2 [Ambispora gerdemannii]|uniref:12198_t:CDS:1 n=1 Tax=Ambispora gerdemannii TaxID=144530 RepID=A0A9N9DA10_9GLOM|nr:12198_t:CDS:2 [Ambispora gerdemannii]
MSDTRSKIDDYGEIVEVKAENIKVKAENIKLRQVLEEHEVRFTNLEQRDKEKTNLIAKLDDDIKKIKQSSTNTSISPEMKSDNTHEQTASRKTGLHLFRNSEDFLTPDTSDNVSNSDIYQELKTRSLASSRQSSIHTETKSLEDKKVDEFLNSTYKEKVSKEIIQCIREKKLQDQELSSILVEEPCEKVRLKVSLEQNSKSMLIQPEETKVSHDYIVIQDFIQEVSSGFTDEEIIEVINVLTTNMTIKVKLAHLFLKYELYFKVYTTSNSNYFSKSKKVRQKVPLDQNNVVNHVSNTESTNIISRADMIKKISSIAQKSVPPIFESEVDVSISSVSVNSKIKISIRSTFKTEKKALPKKTLSEKQNNSTYTHDYFHNKLLEQYPDLYKEYNFENVDYYEINTKLLCLICKLSYKNEEDIEAEYKN